MYVFSCLYSSGSVFSFLWTRTDHVHMVFIRMVSVPGTCIYRNSGGDYRKNSRMKSRIVTKMFAFRFSFFWYSASSSSVRGIGSSSSFSFFRRYLSIRYPFCRSQAFRFQLCLARKEKGEIPLRDFSLYHIRVLRLPDAPCRGRCRPALLRRRSRWTA